MTCDVQVGLRVLDAAVAFHILLLMSLSVPLSLLTTLPRYVNCSTSSMSSPLNYVLTPQLCPHPSTIPRIGIVPAVLVSFGADFQDDHRCFATTDWLTELPAVSYYPVCLLSLIVAWTFLVASLQRQPPTPASKASLQRQPPTPASDLVRED